MIMKKFLTIVVLASVVAGLPSCNVFKRTSSATEKAHEVVEQPQDELGETVANYREKLAGEWTIYTVGGHKVTGENRPYINFSMEDNKIYGSNGCNIVNGDMALDGQSLRLNNVISTMMACPDAPYEQAINLALENTRTYSIAKKGHEFYLELKNGSKQTVMVLRKHNMDFLNGTWRIEEIDGQKYDNPEMQMVLDVEELKLHGNTGCNLVNGSLIIDPDKSNSVQFNNLSSTRMMCAPEQMAAETACLVALESVEYAKSGRHSTVQLLDKNNKVVMVIKKVRVER